MTTFAVSWWFGSDHPTAHDIGMMGWRIVRCVDPVAAVLIALQEEEIATYRNPHPLALVFRGSHAPRNGDYIHGYRLNLDFLPARELEPVN